VVTMLCKTGYMTGQSILLAGGLKWRISYIPAMRLVRSFYLLPRAISRYLDTQEPSCTVRMTGSGLRLLSIG
jgi:hypothetical protein